jgi:hypothetical protein
VPGSGDRTSVDDVFFTGGLSDASVAADEKSLITVCVPGIVSTNDSVPRTSFVTDGLPPEYETVMLGTLELSTGFCVAGVRPTSASEMEPAGVAQRQMAMLAKIENKNRQFNVERGAHSGRLFSAVLTLDSIIHDDTTDGRMGLRKSWP